MDNLNAFIKRVSEATDAMLERVLPPGAEFELSTEIG